MRLRHLIQKQKTQISDTEWREGDMTPRHAPYFRKTKPVRRRWKWRSAQAEDRAGIKYVIVYLCNFYRNNWKSTLAVQVGKDWSVVGRFEYHGSHPGLHCHADCNRGGIETGTTGLDVPRIPDTEAPHRRNNTWTDDSFWRASKKFFRIQADDDKQEVLEGIYHD